MPIHLILDPSRAWAWQAALIDSLRAAGHEVGVSHAAEAERRPLPAAYSLLEALERIFTRGPAPRYAKRLETPPAAAALSSPADWTIDLAGGAPAGAKKLSLRYDGGGEDEALLALCAGNVPLLSLVRDDGAIFDEALPAIETPLLLTRALDHLFSRALSLCRAAALRSDAPGALTGDVAKQKRAAPAMRGAFAPAAGALLAAALREKLTAKLKKAPRWRTGHRFGAGQDRVIDTGRWPAQDYALWPDDGQRFFADPFPVWRDGVCHIFVEEYPFAKGKGILSVATLDAQGRASAPRAVLERPYHLSYPMIFFRDGEFWMIPETSNAGTIELYRADPFPDRWLFERVLVESVIASDMTLLEQGGKLWLLGTLAEKGGSTWDGLGVFFADHLFGQWRPHAQNPLLIDASCARPAGMTVATPRGLLRPVQDCRGRYGAALALARIDRLDEEGFSQTVLSRLAPDPRWGAVGTHTLNESDGVECVDWIAESP